MKNYERERNNPRQMIRKDGYDCFVEFILPTPDFNKVCVNAVKYDKNTHKQLSMITVYYSVSEFLALCTKMIFGKVAMTVEQEKARMAADTSGSTYGNQLFKSQGGTEYANGEVIARALYITPATKSKSANLMLTLERGAGYKTKEGLFNIDYKKGGIEKVMVPLTYDDLIEIGVTCQMRIQAYYTARQIRGDFDDVKNTATNDGTAPGTTPTQYTPEQAIVGSMKVVDTIDGYY